MDSWHFDALTRSLTEAGTRRGVLGLLATLPILGGLLALVDHDDGDAQGRRRRRKKRHKHGKGRRRKHHTHCTAKSRARTCAGRCGIVKNNCQKKVDCGSCLCDPPCLACHVCNNGGCIPCPACCDADGNCQDGDTNAACGSNGACVVCTGQDACQNQQCVCVPNCDGKTCGPNGCGDECGPGCAPCEVCFQGDCLHVCDGSDCCDNGICTDGTGDSACGTDGNACVTCTPPETCGGGNPGTPGVCG